MLSQRRRNVKNFLECDCPLGNRELKHNHRHRFLNVFKCNPELQIPTPTQSPVFPWGLTGGGQALQRKPFIPQVQVWGLPGAALSSLPQAPDPPERGCCLSPVLVSGWPAVTLQPRRHPASQLFTIRQNSSLPERPLSGGREEEASATMRHFCRG